MANVLHVLASPRVESYSTRVAKAKYAVAAGQTPRDEAEAAWQAVIETIHHFKGFARSRNGIPPVEAR